MDDEEGGSAARFDPIGMANQIRQTVGLPLLEEDGDNNDVDVDDNPDASEDTNNENYR